MFEKLLGIATGSFGRTLLVAGIVPALVALLVPAAYFVPAKTLAAYTDKLMQESKAVLDKGEKAAAKKPPAEAPAELIFGVLLLGGLSGLLFAGRGAALRYLESVPFPVRIQAWLRTRQERRRNRALKDRQDAEFARSCVYWVLNKLDEQPKFCPDSEPVADLAELAARSERAIESFAGAAPGNERIAAVRDGARALYLLGCKFHHDGEFARQKEQWRSALVRPGFRDLLNSVDLDLNRQWVAAYFRFNQYPSSPWLRPTTLGNKIVAIDEYGQSRYGIETSTLLNRIWWVVTDGDKESVGASKLAVESLVNLALAFAVAGIVISAAALRQTASVLGEENLVVNWRALGLVPSCFVLSWLSYLAAAAAAAVDGLRERVVGLIDMYRLRALAELGFAPKTFDAELAIFRELQGFFVQAKPLASAKEHYVVAKPDEDKPERGGS